MQEETAPAFGKLLNCFDLFMSLLFVSVASDVSEIHNLTKMVYTGSAAVLKS